MAEISGAPQEMVVLRAFHRLGIPLHPRARSRSLSGRLPDGAVVRILAERFGGRWLKVAAANGAMGWITRRYIAGRRRRAARHGRRRAAPHGRRRAARGRPVVCPPPLARGPHLLRVERVRRMVATGSQRRAALPRRLVVASYNVWELYDGRGGDRYYSRKHAGSLSPNDVKQRVVRLAAKLRPERPHVIAFQEIENAELACRVAALAVPGYRWRCAAGAWKRRSTPQNIAIATRVGGAARILTPRSGFAPRGAVELLLPGGKLRVITVHLKSSRGARGWRDCRNANRRRAMADALVAHLRGAPEAALVMGDFNFDPLKVKHDLTDDVLLRASFRSLRQRFYPGGAPSTYPAFRSTIDLAFFRPGAGAVATGFRVRSGAGTTRWTSDHVPVVATFKLR